jgi:hypothetical protein
MCLWFKSDWEFVYMGGFSSIPHSFLCGFFIFSFFACWCLERGLMVMDIVFNVEKKIHCIPWKYEKKIGKKNLVQFLI